MFAGGHSECNGTCDFDLMVMVGGYLLLPSNSFLEFDAGGGWHYPSYFPVPRFCLYVLRYSRSEFSFSSYYMYKHWSGYGWWDRGEMLKVYRRKYPRYWSWIDTPYDCRGRMEKRRVRYGWLVPIKGLWDFIDELMVVMGYKG